MSIKVSVVIPGIRVKNWSSVYTSICKSTTKEFELIICGPYLPENELANIANFKFIKDYGSPVRASMLAANIAEGEFIVWSADDALFLPGQLDRLIEEAEKNNSIVTCKYLEGKNGTHKVIQPNQYFALNGSFWTQSNLFHNEWYLFNAGIMRMDKFKDLHGWDCAYQGTFYSHADLAARAYLQGHRIIFNDSIILLDCDHSQNDHQPIEDAQTNYDMPLFKERYCSGMLKLPSLKKWNECPSIWEKRFKLDV